MVRVRAENLSAMLTSDARVKIHHAVDIVVRFEVYAESPDSLEKMRELWKKLHEHRSL